MEKEYMKTGVQAQGSTVGKGVEKFNKMSYHLLEVPFAFSTAARPERKRAGWHISVLFRTSCGPRMVISECKGGEETQR